MLYDRMSPLLSGRRRSSWILASECQLDEGILDTMARKDQEGNCSRAFIHRAPFAGLRSQAGTLVLILLLQCASSDEAAAQTALRAHYSDGQIWIVWQASVPLPETFGVYASASPITSVSGAELIGRPFEYEYTPGALREQLGPPSLGWVIPAAAGAGVDTLAVDEALFVETAHAIGDRYYAVVAWGDSTVTSDNATAIPVNAVVGPGETVSCHLQAQFSTSPGFVTRAYAMWADGREDPEDRRPDFPIMANRAKNGMPSLFLVSGRENLGPGPRSVSYWLHGGGGRAMQSTPGSRQIYGIDPNAGWLVAHNDDLVRWHNDGSAIIEEESNSWWFGWGIHYDPFAGLPASTDGEVIINYTQRRLMWIHDWLILQGWIDPDRASVIGHSLGAAGTTALGKAFPDAFGSCTIFNSGFDGPNFDGVPHGLYGEVTSSLKTNLMVAPGDSVSFFDVYDLHTPISPRADLPFFRVFHGKNDDNGVMSWDAFVVAEYTRADSIGWGMHLYWDERPHAPSIGDFSHWAAGYAIDQQTQRDNVDYQEKYVANRSFPAFYNHREKPGASDPGDGTPGTGGTGVGDDWGSWGGYHDWEVNTLVDVAGMWEATIYLIGQSNWSLDNSPLDSLVSDFMIRKPQAFLPAPGEVLLWDQTETASGDTLRSGALAVDLEGRVRLADLVCYRDPRRTRIRFRRPMITSVDHAQTAPMRSPQLMVAPNPFNARTTIRFTLTRPGSVTLSVHDLRGRRVVTPVARWFAAGEHTVRWDGRDRRGRPLASGSYLLHLASDGSESVRMVTLLK